ncbi:hypothetical protein GCM10027296_47570 [Chitinimonas naiadis]
MDNEFIGQEIDYSDDKMQLTKMVAIDDLNLDRLDFIKIDIEGMEMDALMGAERAITNHKPQMLIEKLKSDEAGIRSFLEDRGYKILQLGINLLAVHESDPVCAHITIV